MMRAKPFFMSVLAAAALGFGPAAGLGQSSLSVANLPGFPGNTVSLPVLLRRATNVTAAQFDLAYHPGRAVPANAFAGGVFSNHVVRTREISPGVRRVLIFSRTNAAVTVTNNQSVVQIPFTVAAGEYVGSGPIVPGNAILSEANATPVTPLTLNAGAIFVRSVHLEPAGVQLFLPAEVGRTYVIEATTNFVTWTDLSTNTAFGDFLNGFDPFATNFPYRFYRTRRDP
jgi:hypothetical protein